MANFELKKRLILAGLAILLIADGAFAYAIVRITQRRLNPQAPAAQKTRLALVQADVKRASQIKEKIPEVLKEFDQFEKSSLPPANKGYSVISEELAAFARDTHLQIEEIRFHQKELTGQRLDELEIESTVGGDYTGIVRFLNHLQRSKNVYIINSLQVETASSQNSPAGRLRVSLHLLSYFRKV